MLTDQTVEQKLRDIVIVLEQLYAIKRDSFDMNDTGKNAMARLDPEYVASLAECSPFWSRFKRHCPTCGK
jgi:hypothetical protein